MDQESITRVYPGKENKLNRPGNKFLNMYNMYLHVEERENVE